MSNKRIVFSIALGFLMAIEAALVVYLYVSSSKVSAVRLDAGTRPDIFQSQTWIESERTGNDATGLDKSDIQTAIVLGARGLFKEIIGQSVCAPESKVYTSTSSDVISSHSVKEGILLDKVLTSQLIYRAIYENQYGPAREEAKTRVNLFDQWQKQARETDSNLGLFDFHCPNAKFIIFEGFTKPTGLGSHLRSRMAMPVLLTGLAHGRIVHYIPTAENPITIVGCDRHDLQCSFLPMSPCILTKEEIENAPVASDDWDDYLKNKPNQRVVKISNAVEKHFAPAMRLADGKLKIIENFWTEKQRAERLDILIRGISRIISEVYFGEDVTQNQEKNDRPRFENALRKGFNDNDNFLATVEAAAQLFITRPNHAMRDEISKAIKQSFPHKYNSSVAVGMPIRGSDKCYTEQECVHFDELMNQMYKEFPMDDVQYIIVTSEDMKVLDSAIIWMMKKKHAPELIINKDDIGQATGQFIPGTNPSMNLTKVMTSTMSAWAYQLRAAYSFLNTCSNFHRLFEASIEFGCSVAKIWKRQNVSCNVIV